jgi:glycosyltransferase involved in cell wall biosynthesis
MRINVLGNFLNWGMAFGGLLRAAGHDVRVFVNRRENDNDPFYRPEWEYPDFSLEKYPFVEFVDLAHWRVIAPGAQEKEFLSRLADCDIIQTFGEDALWASQTGRPYVVLSYGFDLEFMPFAGWGPKALIRRVLIRRAFRKASAFVYAFHRHHDLVKRLDLTNAVFEPSAVPLDTARYSPLPESERRALRSAWSQRWVFFHGARQEWYGRDRTDSNAKSNDYLFRAFARFLRDEPDSLLIAVRKGRDVGRSEALIRELGISANVQWIPPMTKANLVRLLNSVDAFCDQFSTGYCGVAALEALSCGVPVFTFLDPNLVGEAPLPPVLRSGTTDETYAALKRFVADPQGVKSLGCEGREWVLKYHSWEASALRYGELYRRCLSREGDAS